MNMVSESTDTAVMISVFIRKLDGISDEQFLAHYSKVHATMAIPLLKKHGCQRYVQSYCMQESGLTMFRKVFGHEQEVGKADGTLAQLPFDGFSTFSFPSYRHALAFFSDIEGHKDLSLDVIKFTDPSTVRVAIVQMSTFNLE